jgi:hypothetical protein
MRCKKSIGYSMTFDPTLTCDCVILTGPLQCPEVLQLQFYSIFLLYDSGISSMRSRCVSLVSLVWRTLIYIVVGFINTMFALTFTNKLLYFIVYPMLFIFTFIFRCADVRKGSICKQTRLTKLTHRERIELQQEHIKNIRSVQYGYRNNRSHHWVKRSIMFLLYRSYYGGISIYFIIEVVHYTVLHQCLTLNII